MTNQPQTLNEALDALSAAFKGLIRSLNPFKKKTTPTGEDELPFDVEFGGVTYEKGTSLKALIRKAEMFKAVGFQKQHELNLYKKAVASIINSEGENHLQWLHDRLLNVHNERYEYDYMIKFREIIENLANPQRMEEPEDAPHNDKNEG